MARDDPFDGDALCQRIYAAGAGDPFLARELADSVAFFLRADGGDADDMAARVVRELGHPRLARNLEQPAAESTNDGTYPSNLLAAQDAGLLAIDRPSDPGRLVGGIVAGPRCGAELDWLYAMERATAAFRHFWTFAEPAAAWDGEPADLGRLLRLGGKVSGLPAVVNLALAEHATQAEPSLFDGMDVGLDRAGQLRHGLGLLNGWPPDEVPVLWRWHITGDDLADSDLRPLMEAVCEQALCRGQWQFVRDGSFGVGVSRSRPAVLESVDLRLDALLQHGRASVLGPNELAKKVASLTRLALAVGRAKRKHLRARGVSGGFVVDRATLLIRLEGHEALNSATSFDSSAVDEIVHEGVRQALDTDILGGPAAVGAPDWPRTTNSGDDGIVRVDRRYQSSPEWLIHTLRESGDDRCVERNPPTDP